MTEEKKQKHYTPAVALTKAEAWCAFQERSQQEVRDKLYSWGQYPDAVENIIAELISRGFLNEERFALAFSSGKFRIKKWGRVKIRVELKRKKVSDYCIRKALAAIDEDEYLETLRRLAHEKMKATKEPHPLKKKYKVMGYLVSRGFENELIREILGEE